MHQNRPSHQLRQMIRQSVESAGISVLTSCFNLAVKQKRSFPMSEKDYFLNSHQRECRTTLNLLRNYPPTNLSFRPHQKSRSSKELAFVLANQELIFKQTAEGALDFGIFANQPPASLAEIIALFEKNSSAVDAAIGRSSDDALNKTINFMGHDMRRLDAMWANLFDLVHHRGQFSVYVRMAGGKVPSIYGPSADEPGMAAKG